MTGYRNRTNKLHLFDVETVDEEIVEEGITFDKEEILELNKLAQILRKQRLAAGAIDFDRIEVKFEIDETGKPLSVYFKESKEANKLIEEFMLLLSTNDGA